jgi:lysophospholipase L1-like esterase
MKIGFFGDSLTEALPGVNYVDMVQAMLPDDVIHNYGKAGDTVITLDRRIQRIEIDIPLDVAVIWIGVNEVLREVSRLYPFYNGLMGVPRSNSPEEFRAVYTDVLDFLGGRATRLIAAPPVLIGENLDNSYCRRLADLAAIEKELIEARADGDYVDLAAVYRRALDGKPISGYLPSKGLRILLDTRLTDEQIDAMSARRGLHVTLDGVHLNSAGARLAAEAFVGAIGG